MAQPSSELVAIARSALSKDSILSKAPATVKSYGDFSTLTGGVIGEFKDWCEAGPGVEVRGVTTPADKKPYSVVGSPGTVFVYFDQHLSRRKKLRSNGSVKLNAHGASVPIEKDTLNQQSKALMLFHQYCISHGTLPVDTPTPNFDKALTAFKRRMSRNKAALGRRTYKPRGAAVIAPEYTSEQHIQMSRYGLFDGAPGGSSRGARLARINHVMADGMVLRYDDRRLFGWADLCLKTAPAEEGPMVCKVLCATVDDDKTNDEGAWRTAAAMRHTTDPTVCSAFALALEMFMQFEVERVAVPNNLREKRERETTRDE